ncbi:UNVERIFIED_CONTAM: hypothetical protein Sindi_1398900 [Sesamum indicum]
MFDQTVLPSKSHPIVTDVEDQLCRCRQPNKPSPTQTVRNGLMKLLEESLGLVDLCGFARDVLSLTKDLFKIFSPPSGEIEMKSLMLKETEAFGFSVLKSILILLSGEKERSKQQNWSFLSKFIRTSRVEYERDQECCSESSLSLELPKSGKDMNTIDMQNVLKQLQASEMTIQELEEELEAFFRSSLKTRVSLLNALNH